MMSGENKNIHRNQKREYGIGRGRRADISNVIWRSDVAAVNLRRK